MSTPGVISSSYALQYVCHQVTHSAIANASERERSSSSTMRSKGNTTLQVGADGVALITIIHPPVNALSYDGNASNKSLSHYSVHVNVAEIFTPDSVGPNFQLDTNTYGLHPRVR